MTLADDALAAHAERLASDLRDARARIATLEAAQISLSTALDAASMVSDDMRAECARLRARLVVPFEHERSMRAYACRELRRRRRLRRRFWDTRRALVLLTSGHARDVEASVLRTLDALAAQHPDGALLSVRDMRASGGFGHDDGFDRAVLALRDAGLVTLHHHDYPASLTDRARRALVREGDTYYCGIARRRRP